MVWKINQEAKVPATAGPQLKILLGVKNARIMVRYLSPEFVLLLGNPSMLHSSGKARCFFLEPLGADLTHNLFVSGQLGLHRFSNATSCFSPLSCTICSGTNTMPFLPSPHFPVISTSASHAETPLFFVRSPLLPVCFLLSWVSLSPSHQTSHLWIRGIISAPEAATALFPLAMAFLISFWKSGLPLWKMLHLSHLHSFSHSFPF